MGWTKTVYSSNASEVGYDDETGEMTVTWNNGRTSAYQGVSEETAFTCAQSASVGQFINSEIKPFYSHRYR